MPTTNPMAASLRPLTRLPRRPSTVPQCRTCKPPTTTAVRRKSGPFGYTQAKALVFSRHGEPSDVLSLHTHSISASIPPNQVLVRTLAAPINPADINTLQGIYGTSPEFKSLIGTAEPSAVPGNEGVFEVVSAGQPARGEGGELRPGDWVFPRIPHVGTWRTHALLPAEDLLRLRKKEGLTPVQAALMSVNPCSAYRMLRGYGPGAEADFGEGLPMRPLKTGSGEWFIQNGANSGVGRAAIQLGKLWGLRSINIIRGRESPTETSSLVQDLRALGANHIITEREFLSSSWADRLASILNNGREQIGLGLNCVGGKSATAIARSLGQGATMVSYGGMARQPLSLPVGALIFKDIRFVGFWLSRWNERDPGGRRHMIEHLGSLIRAGKFVDVPVEEVRWDWDTEDKVLREAAQGSMEGFRKGKAVFVFGDT